MGGWPGIVPGQIALGQSSALAGAPSMTGGIFSICSSSLGNLNPASLNALPKSFSLGKSIWQVLQLVPYILENAGIAKLRVELSATAARTAIKQKFRCKRKEYLCISFLLCSYCQLWVVSRAGTVRPKMLFAPLLWLTKCTPKARVVTQKQIECH